MTKRAICRHGLRAFERDGRWIHAHDGSTCQAARPAPPPVPPEPEPAPPEPEPAPPPVVAPAAPTRVPLAYERALTTDTAMAPADAGRPAPRRSPVWPVVSALVAGLLLLGAGAAAGVIARNGAVDDRENRAVAAERRVASLQEQLKTKDATIDDQQSQITRDEQQLADLRTRERRLEQQREAQQGPAGPNATSFGDGLYQANVAIQPGQYHTDGSSACYWAKLSTGDTDSIIENHLTSGPQTVTIDSPYFESENCGTWSKVT
jgi:hypothetical protein